MVRSAWKASIVLTAVLLAACSPMPPSADLISIEPAARRMPPQDNVALLYILTTKDQFNGNVIIYINKEFALSGDLPGWFYAFCLPPGKYEIEYVGGGFFSKQKELVIAKAGEIHVRDVRKSVIAGLLLVLPNVVDVDALDVDRARALVSTRRLSGNPIYQSSAYRCRTLTG